MSALDIPAFHLSDEASSLTLRAVDDAEGSYTATIESRSGMRASVAVAIGRNRFGEFFESMAREWRGWDGERVFTAHVPGVDYGGWAMRLGGRADGRGHVVVQVDLGMPWLWINEATEYETHVGFPPPTRPGSWSARLMVHVEAGQLDRLAEQASSLPQDTVGLW